MSLGGNQQEDCLIFEQCFFQNGTKKTPEDNLQEFINRGSYISYFAAT
jgi:hypothetical protein